MSALPRAEGWGGGTMLPALLALAFGLFGIVLPQSDFFRAIPGDLGDARFNGLILEHVFRWLSGIDASLWSPGFFFPFPGALTFSDNHFGTVGVYALLRMFGLSAEVAFIGWFTFAYVANFLCACYVLRRFGLTASGSALGAFVFAFAMPVLVQAGHAQLGYRFAVPLAILALHRLLRDGHPAQLGWLGFWVTLQFYCSIYLGYFLLLLLGGYLLAAYLVPSSAPGFMRPDRIIAGLIRWPVRGELWRCIGVLLACVIALFALFAPYAYYADLYGLVRNPADIDRMLPRIGSYLLADSSRLWGRFSQHLGGIPMRQEHQMFVGVAACLLALVGIARGASHWLKVSALALALLVVLTLNVSGLSLYAFVEQLPMANAIRAVSRIGLVMVFPLGLLAGAGFDRLVVGSRGRAGPILAVVLTILLLLECATLQTLSVPLSVWRDRLALRLAEVPAALPADAIVYVPRQPNEPQFMTELDGMNVAQRLGRNTINGYSGNSPPGFGQTIDPCDDLIDRLTGYAHFMRLEIAQVDALARRVFVVGATLECALPGALPARMHFKGALPNAAFARVHVEIAGVAIANAQQLEVELVVSNGLDTVLASVSESNQPIRFSWRFVSADSGVPVSTDWATRSELRKDVPAHAREQLRLLIDAPIAPGRYRLEMTLLQENVAWFHERGMPIARSAQVVTVGSDSRIQPLAEN
ncbi:MAG: hypothetical protein WAR01_01390 [Dokdonella sp.]|uniref:hypothetical protein n=1 Tax=Dokdonella sp. TaxID=2291710 RepID=UPI002B98C0CA|nr:hypothetical protein [Xanthomonadales bacterium]MBL0221678.1 hypothetical protein [Xanthomonadales bacterium]HQV72691.1 hypothetical protein [Dokdonella sp.]HQX66186.1 hypothetical protein [Dokdonella sp.]HQZ62566.1 hypothetical protein [Dokdonella sp.]